MSKDYDDIYLVPTEISKIPHRGDVSLSCPELDGLYPIISSPMAGISGPKLVIEMGKLNCLGILHRFDNPEKRKSNIDEISKAKVPFGIAIGINEFGIELGIADHAIKNGAKMIVVDIANGYLPQMATVGKELRYEYGDKVKLMAGNVITYSGAKYLKDSGFDWCRVGIGSGSNCTTRTVTAVGRNQLRALDDCANADIFCVSDGGIDASGKAVLSYFFGAKAVMLGGILGRAKESDNSGLIYGMASKRNHIKNNKEVKSIEGKETIIEDSEKRPLKEIINEFLWGIRSACTYGNCKSYTEIQNNFNWEYNSLRKNE